MSTLVFDAHLHTQYPGNDLVHLARGNPNSVRCYFQLMGRKFIPVPAPTWQHIGRRRKYEAVTHVSLWDGSEWVMTVPFDKPVAWGRERRKDNLSITANITIDLNFN